MSASDLNDRVALITGAAGGIGQALARAFVGAGMRAALCDTSETGVLRLHDEIGADRTIAPTGLSPVRTAAYEAAHRLNGSITPTSRGESKTERDTA